MLLYHGSNVSVEVPKLLASQRALDFGAGFYLTSQVEQAAKWAQSVRARRGEGTPTISAYEVDDETFVFLDVLHFREADGDWLRFVTANRKQAYVGHTWDVVIGPVANDRTMTVLTLYFNGLLSEDETLKRLMVQRLYDQYAFCTGRALRQLSFKEAFDV